MEELTKEFEEFQEYIKIQKQFSPNTQLSYIRDIRHFYDFLKLTNKKIKKVTTETLSEYQNYLKYMGKSSATINRSVASLRCYFDFLVERHIIKSNFAKGASLYKGIQCKAASTLTLEEVEKLLRAPDTLSFKGCRDKAMLEVLYAKGIKVSVLICLNVGDFNLSAGTIFCGSNQIKRCIPLYTEAKICLETYLQRLLLLHPDISADSALFVNNRGDRMTRQGFWKVLKTYSTQIHIHKDITPQTLRQSFAVHLLQNGANVHDVQKMLGHADISTTQRYVKAAYSSQYADVYSRCHPKAQS